MVKKFSKFCGFCGLPLEEFQLDVLKEGETIFCSACGHKVDPEGRDRKKRDLLDRDHNERTPIQKDPIKRYPNERSKPRRISTIPSSKFQTFQKAPYTPPPSGSIPVDHKTYKEIQTSNKAKLKQVMREIEVVLKKPLEHDQKVFQKQRKNLTQEYQKVNNKNQHEFQLAILHNENADEHTLRKIKEDYDRIKRKNKKQNSAILKTFKKHYKNIHKQNKNTYSKIKQENKKHYEKITELNEKTFEKIEDGKDVSQDFLLEFKPIHPDPHSRIIYNPNEVFKDDESTPKVRSLENPLVSHPPKVPKIPKIPAIPKMPDIQPIVDSIEHTLKEALDSIPPTKKARFDPYTGKSLKKAVKFDPFTGKPIEKAKEKNIISKLEKLEKLGKIEQLGTLLEKQIKEELSQKAPESSDQETEVQPEKQEPAEEKVFTVLSPQIRTKLLALDISDEEQINIGKNFIYLSELQQNKYLDEIQAIFSSESPNLDEYLGEIRKLPIPTPQQETLVHQLEFIAEEQHPNYLETLKGAAQEKPNLETQKTLETQTQDKEIEEPSEKEDKLVPKSDSTDSRQELEVEKAQLVALKKEREQLKKKQEEIEKREQMELERKERLKKLKDKVRKEKESA